MKRIDARQKHGSGDTRRGSVMKWAAIMLITIVLAGCSRRHQPYGAASNTERSKRNIPVIQPTWVAREGRAEGDWTNPRFQDPARPVSEPIYASKQVLADGNGNPRIEYDHYYSGKFVKALDPDHSQVHEMLVIVYDWSKAATGGDPWSAKIASGGVTDRSMSLSEAEALLTTWGLNRLTP